MPEGIRKKGATYSYRVNVKNEATGKWKNVEKGGFRTIAEAKAARAEKQAEINVNPNSVLVKDKAISLQDVYDEFIHKQAKFDREKSTIKRYDSLYRNHLQLKWGSRQIGTIKATELTDYLFSLTATHAYAYIQGIQKFMKVIWNFADSREYMKTNIIDKVTIPAQGVEEGEIKIYTEEQLDVFEKRFSSTNLITAFKIGRALGVRVGETFGLLWSDIDWNKRTIKVTKQLVFEDKMWTLRNTKTKASIREIDLQDDIYDYLKELKVKQEQQKAELGIAYRQTRVAIDKGRNKPKEIVDNLDFINVKPNGELLTPDSEKVLGRLARNELELNFKYHNLRHTHCSRLAEMNVPMVVVKQRLGHSKEETTMRYYTHLTEGMRENLVNSLNSL
jgi:integrase